MLLTLFKTFRQAKAFPYNKLSHWPCGPFPPSW